MIQERLSYAHAGDHALLENEAAMLDFVPWRMYGGFGHLTDEQREARRLREEERGRREVEALDKYRLHLRTHLVIYHHTRLEDIAEYGHNAASDTPRHLLQRLHEELHSDLIDRPSPQPSADQESV